ncbi:MAG: hypothetical protein FJ100_14940 [Deltaproteobacteria bacterium]|nr:hypothetical protein [Deltaproteobacteria bacterium]
MVAVFFAILVGCGEIQVSAAPGEDLAVAVTGDGVGADAAPGDTVPPDTIGADAAESAAAECVTDFDCVLSSTVKGKNPCSPPVCNGGQCVTKKKPAGTACIDNTLAPGECQSMACNDSGLCDLVNKKDGAVCGLGSCGKKCEVGLCVAASATDYDDSNPCTKDYCNQGIEVVHEPITDLTAFCDDGDACSANDTCLQGACKGLPVQCGDGVECTKDACDPKVGCGSEPQDKLCDDGNPCTTQKCDKSQGCVQSGAAAGGSCDDGNPCTKDDKCTDQGTCGGTATCACQADADCKQDNLCLGPPSCVKGLCVNDPAKAVLCSGPTGSSCLVHHCEPKTGTCGLDPVEDGKGCDDANACSSVSTCEAGKCEGLFDVKCDDKNPCTDDVCGAQTGCAFAPNDNTCDDGNACTTGDACSKGACTGAAKNCDDNVTCTLDACDAKTGACTNVATNGKCDDGNPCTADSCDAKAGCKAAANDSGTCEDGDPCTTNKCAAGKCTATLVCQCKDDSGCNDNNPCTLDSCSAGKCTNTGAPQDGKACDTGDKCQLAGSGVCAAGVCKSGNKPVNCTAPGACQTAACNPATGKCETGNKPDGISCDADGNGCTQADKCVAGKCTAGNPANCASASTACADGTCNSTGPGTFACKPTPKTKGTACEDGKYCTGSDTCDGGGTCVAGAALSCAAQNDACNTGTCDETKKQCVKTPKATSVACDDAQYCTTADHCDAGGKCVGGGTLNCPGGNCQVGACDEANDNCGTKPAASGTACTDNSVCTATDTCDAAGVCKGGAPLACDDKNPCTKDACDAAKGCTYTPVGGTACDDGNACTTGDKCDATGKCQAGTFTCQCTTDSGCNDGNACTTDKCASNKCSNTITAGTACDDKNPCTLASACDAAGACVPDATKPYDCSASSDACNSGSCYDNAGVAACKKVPKANTTACEDGLFCTSGDKCDGAGKCAGGPPPTCGKPATCYQAVCTEAAKGCTSQPLTKGTACSDGNACTSGDNCDGAGKCAAGSALPDFALCDDGNATTSGDFCYKQACAGFAQYPGPVGPTASVKYLATPAGYQSVSLAEAKLDANQTGAWGVFAHNGTVVKQTASLGTAVPPFADLASQVIVGSSSQVWFYAQGGTGWAASNALGSNLKSVFSPGADWTAVDTYLSGTNLYVGLVGFSPNLNGSVTAQCTVDATGKTSSCVIKTFSSTLRFFDSYIRTHLGCLSGCSAAPMHNALALVQGSTAGVYQALNAYETSSWGGTYTTYAGPAYAASTNTMAGLWRASTSILTPQTGSTVRWLVGPAGAVGYEKVGTSGISSAIVTKATQSNYYFTAVLKVGGYTLLYGTRPDPANGASRQPVFLAHQEVANTQSGTAYWTEIALDTPSYDKLTCFANYPSSTGATLGPDAIVGFLNTCSTGGKGGTASLRSTVMFRRGL